MTRRFTQKDPTWQESIHPKRKCFMAEEFLSLVFIARVNLLWAASLLDAMKPAYLSYICPEIFTDKKTGPTIIKSENDAFK
jgi:hypothetical protein